MLRPARNMAFPPEPLVPLPTPMVTAPARPTVATPELTQRAPAFPVLAEPELNDNLALAPAAPEFTPRMLMAPELVVAPSPLSMTTTPPDLAELRPDVRLKRPPLPLVPLPAVTPKVPP